MTKIEKLAAAATTLNDEQIEGLIAYVTYLTGEPLVSAAPAEVNASIDLGLADAAAGRLVDGEGVFADAARRIAAARG